MASGISADIGSPEFMDRKRKELRDRIESMGGRDELEKHGAHVHNDREGREFDGYDRKGPLDKFGANMDIDADRANFFNSLHDSHTEDPIASKGSRRERREREKKQRTRGDTHLNDRDREPHPNPQIQAKIDAMRDRRNVSVTPENHLIRSIVFLLNVWTVMFYCVTCI